MQQVVFAPQMYGDIYLQRLSDGLIIRATQNKWENGTVFRLPVASVVSAPGAGQPSTIQLTHVQMRLISEIAPVTGKRKHLRDACELSSSTGNRWPSRRRLKETARYLSLWTRLKMQTGEACLVQ